MRRLIIALLVLAGLLVAADFGSAALAESAVSRQMRSQLDLADDPAVRINGFPFLTQAVAGRYSSVNVDASRIEVGQLQELSVTAQLRDVDAPLSMLLGSGEKTLRVREVEGTVRVPAKDVERLVPGVQDLRIETLDGDALEQIAEDAEDPALAGLDPQRTVRLVGTQRAARRGGRGGGRRRAGAGGRAGPDLPAQRRAGRGRTPRRSRRPPSGR
jgi:hypothetical protein